MDKALLERKDFDAFIAAAGKSATVYAPAVDKEGTVFRPVGAVSEMSLGAVNTRLSVKGVFFPQREVLLRYDGSTAEEALLPKGAIVAFGVRPCDAKALLFLDKLFAGLASAPGNVVHQDPYYLERRKDSVVIALACDEPCATCFCTSVGGSPYGTEGADILASAADGAGTAGADPRRGPAEPPPFLLEAVTEKGKAFLEAHAKLLQTAGGDLLAAREAAAKEAAAKMTDLGFAEAKAFADAAFDSPLWDAITRSCLGCGVCTYLCPTCHCFDITDETVGTEGVRVRSWDACQYPLYTMHASGHNPRPAKKARMRQRVMHKYSYTVETAGTVSCSGCGRCVRHCPVNLDIRQMVAALRESR